MAAVKGRGAGLLSVVALAVPLIVGGLVQAPAAAAAEADPALGAFGACIAGGGAADVLLLVDESSSLTSSDAALGRVTSATYFVDQLADFATEAGTPVDVQLSVFGDSYSTLLPWTPLGAESVDGVRASIAGLAERVDGFDTDYWTALDGARADLADRAAGRTGGAGCQAVVWFTDGKLDYFPRETGAERAEYGTQKRFAPGVDLTDSGAAAQVRDAAAADLCRGGGLADQLRSSGITVFGVGLTGPGSTDADFDFIRSVTTGTDLAGTRCGDITEPVPGSFQVAGDIDSLLFAFDAIATPGGAPLTQEAGICQVVACADQAHNFVLDASTPRVKILGSADATGLAASMSLPDGTRVDLARDADGGGSASVVIDASGASIDYEWITEKTVSLTVDRGSSAEAAWVGQWAFTFTDPQGASSDRRSKTNLHISGDLAPIWTNGTGVVLHAGETVEGAVFALVGRGGAAVDPSSILGTMRYTATLQDAEGAVVTVLETEDKTAIGRPIALPLTDAAVGSGLLTLRLEVTTGSATAADGAVVPGTALDPSVVAQRVSIEPPAAYPTFAERVDFGGVEGPVDQQAVLPLAGDGCAWLTPESADVVASPQGLGAVRIESEASSADSCVDSGAAGLPLRLSTEQGGNGAINGTITVMLASSDGSGPPIEVEVPFTASLALPLDPPVFWVAFAITLLIGVAAPVGVLYFAKWLVSVVPARPLVATTVPVEVSDGTVLRGGSRFSIVPEDLRDVVPIGARGSRRVVTGEAVLVARAGAAPTEAGFVRVDRPGWSSASGASPSTTAKGTTARLPLAVHNNWVVFHQPGRRAGSAEVLLLIGGTATPAQRATLADDLNARLPDILSRLVAEEPESDVPAAEAGNSPFGGGGAAETGGFSNFGSGLGSTAAPTAVASPPVAPARPETDDGEAPPRSSPDANPWGTF
ncbi:vWA domain-containing protein [Rathayibacter sp. AY1D1]|uniref:vWA domain-containing protein n=1 Tax=Rathayibacter sp. AY1D1 TaxID=2080542 RepID=UPI0011B07A31|nr:vWA domain-containing protein [Rathayibacter sp. AY1D1]